MGSEDDQGRPRIGVVDDDAAMRDAIAALLRDEGFDPVPMDGPASFHAETAPLDLVLIDLRLRGCSGLDLARDIRRHSDLPIVMLTGRGDETDRIIGLEVGADDYLLKPFNPRELMARIRAVLRRTGRIQSARPERIGSGFGRFTIDLAGRALYDEYGDEIVLTNGEFRILSHLFTRRDEIVARAELLEDLGSDLSRYVDRTIDVMILRLRRKIEQNPSKPVHLQTRRGQGYVLVTRDL